MQLWKYLIGLYCQILFLQQVHGDTMTAVWSGGGALAFTQRNTWVGGATALTRPRALLVTSFLWMREPAEAEAPSLGEAALEWAPGASPLFTNTWL